MYSTKPASIAKKNQITSELMTSLVWFNWKVKIGHTVGLAQTGRTSWFLCQTSESFFFSKSANSQRWDASLELQNVNYCGIACICHVICDMFGHISLHICMADNSLQIFIKSQEINIMLVNKNHWLNSCVIHQMNRWTIQP